MRAFDVPSKYVQQCNQVLSGVRSDVQNFHVQDMVTVLWVRIQTGRQQGLVDSDLPGEVADVQECPALELVRQWRLGNDLLRGEREYMGPVER